MTYFSFFEIQFIGLDWIVGIIGSFIISYFAYHRKSLSTSGFWAAMFTGTLLYALGNLTWFGVLIVFFVSSTLLSKIKHARKHFAEQQYAKGSNRDAGQVFANGGFAVLACICYAIWPQTMFMWAFIGAMATVNADTWATEIGGMSSSLPRSIRTFRLVPAGTSGGISPLGTFAAILGAMTIGASALFFNRAGQISTLNLEAELSYVVIAGIAGLLGALADSWLGATWQVMYRCQNCEKEIEKPEHCDVRAKHIRGVRWMNNDAVNFISSCIGAAIAVILFAWFNSV
jgi:uncharacterized protein (TIGR00297 family)